MPTIVWEQAFYPGVHCVAADQAVRSFRVLCAGRGGFERAFRFFEVFARVEIPADIPRWNALPAANRQHQVCKVLADSFAMLQHVQDGRVDIGRTGE